MARKKQEPEKKKKVNTDGIMGLVGSTTEQPISETLESNYMPYAMSVIVSRAIPEIDGFKPSHRKLLYTMYKMGLLSGGTASSPPTGSSCTPGIKWVCCPAAGPSPPTSSARPCA